MERRAEELNMRDQLQDLRTKQVYNKRSWIICHSSRLGIPSTQEQQQEETAQLQQSEHLLGESSS